MKKQILFLLILVAGISGQNKSMAQANLSLQNVTGAVSGPVSVNVTASGISNMISFQFTIQYDQTKLTYQSLSNWYSGIAGVVTNNNASQGTLTFSYFNITPVSMVSGSTFFTINFTYTSGLAALSWTNTPTPINLMAQGGTQINPTLTNGSVNGGGSLPQITQHPASQTKCVGESVTFSVTATGATGYQWKKNGVNVTSGTGGNTANYTINPVTSGDAANSPGYTCVVSNTTGNVTSDPATLTVKTLSTQPSQASANPSTINPGQSSVLSVTGGVGGTGSTIKWYANQCGGTYIDSGSSITVSPSVTTTYYARIEGDCNMTPCVNTTVNVSNGSLPIQVFAPNIGQCVGNVSIPITVANMNNVGQFSIRLMYNTSTLTYTGYSNIHPSISSGLPMVSNIFNNIILNFFSISPISIQNDTLLNYNFTSNGGSSTLIWDTITQGACQFSTIQGSIMESDYHNGFITIDSLPQTPKSIAGQWYPCYGISTTYSASVINATSYTWGLPPTWTGSSTSSSITVVPGNATTGTISVIANNACGSSSPKTKNITTRFAPPSPPVSITGNSQPCEGSQVWYGVPYINEITYNWQLPQGWTGTTGVTSNDYLVIPGNSSGIISVTASNSCGASSPQTLAVTSLPLPSQPSGIIGITTICQGQLNVTYTVPAITNATSYQWTLPSGASGTSTSNSITVNYSSNAVSGNITVKGINSCGEGPQSSLAVTVNPLPAQPSAITGIGNPCPGSTQTYSIGTVLNASSYTWSLPNGWTGTSATNSITVTVGTTTGTITVSPVNSCGAGGSSSLPVNPNGTIQTYPISGGGTYCEFGPGVEVGLDGSTQGYIYTLRRNGVSTGTVVGGTGSYLSFGYQTVAGTYTAIVNDPGSGCNATCPNSVEVSVTPLVQQPAQIIGSTLVCNTGGSQTYSVVAVPNATSYIWSFPSGWTGSSTTNQITLTVGSSGGIIQVIAQNSCGQSLPRTLSVTVSSAPAVPDVIQGTTTNLCQGTVQTYTVTPVSGASSYSWTLPSGWTGTSTTNSINATVGATNGVINVTANNGCGSSLPRSLVISSVIPQLGQPGSIAGNALPCEGSTVTYTAGTVTGATYYTWTYPSGWSGSSTSNSIALTIGPNSGIISVTPGNTCGEGTARTKSLSVSPLPGPALSITGSASVVQGQSYTYSVPAIANATSYEWNYSGTGASISATINAVTISFAANATSGILTVKGLNACGFGSISPNYPISVTAGGFVISGNIQYPNTAQTLLGNIIVNLKNNSGTTIQTDTSIGGSFLYSPVQPGSYTLSCSTTRPWAGATSMDITLYKKHIANIQPLSGIFLLSGDVNMSGSLSSIDLTYIKNRIAGVSSSFPGGDWLFDPEPITIVNQDINENFYGLCYGDANASNPLSSKSELTELSAEPNGVLLTDLQKNVRIPLYLGQDAQVASATLHLDYPEQWVKPVLVDVNGNTQDLWYSDNNSVLRIMYASLTPMQLHSGDPMFWVDFQVSPAASTQNELNPFEQIWVELGDEQDRVIEQPILYYPQIQFMTSGLNAWQSERFRIRCYPNPFKDALHIEYTLGIPGSVSFELCDLTGRILLSEEKTHTGTGNYSTTFSTETLAAGSYLVRSRIEGVTAQTHKVVLVK